jgi:chitin elicitor receptor kinase 1
MAPPPAHVLTQLLLLALAASSAAAAGDGCTAGSGCDLALGSYLISRDQNLTYIAELFGISDYKTLAGYNPGTRNLDFIAAGESVNVYFRCDCRSLPTAPSSTFLSSSLPYKVRSRDTYTNIAGQFNNLTTADWLAATNSYPATNIPDTGTVNVTVNCSCGDIKISPDYGLFLTYPLAGQTLAAVAANYSFNSPSQLELLRKYNPGMDTATSGLVYIPVKGENF